MEYILGIKKGMTRVFEGDKSVAVTLLDTDSCVISQVSDQGVELGLGKKKKANKALTGKYKDLGYVPQHTIWIPGKYEFKVGDKVGTDAFEVGSDISVKGVSKGKGFAGVVKRWKFKGGPKTHGQSDKHRSPGSIGAGTGVARVVKGKKMAGRMGGEVVTVSGKRVIGNEGTLVMVSGGVPGRRDSVVLVQKVASKSNES